MPKGMIRRLSLPVAAEERSGLMTHGMMSPTNPPTSLEELIAVAKRLEWCTSLGCTTCGALPFRKSLREIPREDVIFELRLMSSQYLQNNLELFRMIIWEISAFGYGGELMDPLADTPAAVHLRAFIDWRHRQDERRRAYADSQTPEAIAESRAKKKADAIQATASHRERKAASQDAIGAVARNLVETPTSKIIALVNATEFSVSYSAIGGIVYRRLVDYYRAEPILPADLDSLTRLAANHGGHWKKLLDRFTQPSSLSAVLGQNGEPSNRCE
jgi:hypothetical protein